MNVTDQLADALKLLASRDFALVTPVKGEAFRLERKLSPTSSLVVTLTFTSFMLGSERAVRYGLSLSRVVDGRTEAYASVSTSTNIVDELRKLLARVE